MEPEKTLAAGRLIIRLGARFAGVYFRRILYRILARQRFGPPAHHSVLIWRVAVFVL